MSNYQTLQELTISVRPILRIGEYSLVALHFLARTAYGVKGNRQSFVVTNNPSSIDANELLTVRFPNLGANDVIVPGTARLAFNITLNGGTDANRTVVNNLGGRL